MKINRVTLYNFSSYVGENTIVLDTHGEQNIILIGGNNGAGKTSFFTAIKLALYGPQCFRFQDKNNRYTARIKELINHVAFLSDNVKSYVEVEIDLPTDRTHTLYTIRREWSFVEKRLHETYTRHPRQLKSRSPCGNSLQTKHFFSHPPFRATSRLYHKLYL